MLIHANWSVALYCQYCGKIEIHDICHFQLNSGVQLLKCSCHHVKAKLMRTASNQLRLQIPCGACGYLHETRFKLRQLLTMKLEPIHCLADNFELGYIGRRESIEEFLEYNKHEFDTMNRDHFGDGEEIEKQLILLEVLNKLHDIAGAGGVVCPCGQPVLDADIVGDSVVIECQQCGRYHLLPARTEADLQKMSEIERIELTEVRSLARF